MVRDPEDQFGYFAFKSGKKKKTPGIEVIF